VVRQEQLEEVSSMEDLLSIVQRAGEANLLLVKNISRGNAAAAGRVTRTPRRNSSPHRHTAKVAMRSFGRSVSA
jgi:hypothetical protein